MSKYAMVCYHMQKKALDNNIDKLKIDINLPECSYNEAYVGEFYNLLTKTTSESSWQDYILQWLGFSPSPAFDFAAKHNTLYYTTDSCKRISDVVGYLDKVNAGSYKVLCRSAATPGICKPLENSKVISIDHLPGSKSGQDMGYCIYLGKSELHDSVTSSSLGEEF